MPTETPTLTEIVEQAHNEQATEGKETPEVRSETVENATSMEAEKLKKEKLEADAALANELEVDASPDEVRQALNLLRQLNDPEKAAATFRFLAEQGGYDLTKRSEAKQLVRDSKAILKEELGDSYDVLGGDAIAKALDRILETKVKEATKPLEDNARLAAQQANEVKADAAMQSFFSRHKIPDTVAVREELAGRMTAKMAKMPPTANTDVNEYLDDIYTVVGKVDAETRTTTKVVTRMIKNAKEAKVSGEGDAIGDERIKRGSKNPSLDEAVRMGFEGKRFDD